MHVARLAMVATLLSASAGFTPRALGQLPPDEALARLETAAGFEVSLFASEPMITNPAAIDVDTHGRVWVAEIEHYRLKSEDPPGEKIKVLEDTDGDGRADRVTVFADDAFAPMSICVAGPKVYVATSPDLWVYEDADGDLRADGPRRKLLTGFGGYNHDHGAHSLVLGPDHKWWMSHGDRGFDVTGTDGSQIKYQWGAMLRGELDGSQLETVAVNFRNPYEIAVSSRGESFCSDNDNDGNFSTRVCWILEGGNYGWFGGPPPRVAPGTPFGEHWHFRGHIPGFVPATLSTGFGSPCGMCYYEGAAFGPAYEDVLFHADAGPREVRVYRHEPVGAGMKASAEVLLSSPTDKYFRPIDVCAAPDGTLLVGDWYDGGVGGHAYNNPDQGRVYLLRPTRGAIARTGKPGPYRSLDDAVTALASPNLATQYLAREFILGAPDAAIEPLERILTGDDAHLAARALWLLDRIGGTGRQAVVAQLGSADPTARALAVRILRRHGATYAGPILDHANDAAAEVRREVLLAIAKFPVEGPIGRDAMRALVPLAKTYDGRDRYLLEAINIAARARRKTLYAALANEGFLTADTLALAQVLDPTATAGWLSAQLADAAVPLDAKLHVIRSLAETPSSDSAAPLLVIVADPAAAAELRRAAADALAANLAGNWRSLAEDGQVHAALRAMLADEALRTRAIATIAGTPIAPLGPDVLAVAVDRRVAADVRRDAIAAAAELRVERAADAFVPLLDDPQPPVRDAARKALVRLQHRPTLDRLLAGSSPGDVQRALADELLADPSGALVLLRLIDDGQLSAELREHVVAEAAQHVDVNVRALFERFVPTEARPQRLGEAIDAAKLLTMKSDAERGRRIFRESSAAACSKCHAVQGRGGALGPDLSQIGNKYDRGALLETILDPSKAIAPEYVPYVLETDQGQLFAGFVVERNDEHVVLKDAESRLIRVPADDVVTLERQAKSLMPELVLRDVTAQDAADLLAFLAGLTDRVQHVGQFRILGPFSSRDDRGLERDYADEARFAAPDLSATYEGLDKRTTGWESVAAEVRDGAIVVDTAGYCRRHRLRATQVVHYLLVYADSASAQDTTLLVDADEGCRVWVNGRLVHESLGEWDASSGEARVAAHLDAGRNTIVVKVENQQEPGLVGLAVASSSLVQLRTE